MVVLRRGRRVLRGGQAAVRAGRAGQRGRRALPRAGPVPGHAAAAGGGRGPGLPRPVQQRGGAAARLRGRRHAGQPPVRQGAAGRRRHPGEAERDRQPPHVLHHPGAHGAASRCADRRGPGPGLAHAGRQPGRRRPGVHLRVGTQAPAPVRPPVPPGEEQLRVEGEQGLPALRGGRHRRPLLRGLLGGGGARQRAPLPAGPREGAPHLPAPAQGHGGEAHVGAALPLR